MNLHLPKEIVKPYGHIYIKADLSLWVVVDLEDMEYFQRWKWNFKPLSTSFDPTYYAKRNTGAARTPVYLHREVTERAYGPAPEGCPLSDHINGNTLDARRHNLRWASHLTNSRNRGVNRTRLVPLYQPEPIAIPF